MIAAIVALAGFALLVVGTLAYHTAVTTAFAFAALWYWGIYHLALLVVGNENSGWAFLVGCQKKITILPTSLYPHPHSI